MWVVVGVAGLLIATVGLNRFVNRERTEPLERHARALAALRDLSERPRPVIRDLEPPPELPDEHIRILTDVPEDARRRRPDPRRTWTPAPPAPTVAVPPAIRIDPVVPTIDADRPIPSPEPVPFAAFTDRRPLPARVLVVAAAAVLIAGLAGFAVFAGTRGGSGPARTAGVQRPPSAPPPTTASPLTTPPTVPVQVARVATLPTGDGSVSVRGPFTLTLHATGLCWIEVTNGTGQVVFQGLLHSGQDQRVTGTTPLIVRLGNTRAITIAINGSPLDLTAVARTANVRFQN